MCRGNNHLIQVRFLYKDENPAMKKEVEWHKVLMSDKPHFDSGLSEVLTTNSSFCEMRPEALEVSLSRVLLLRAWAKDWQHHHLLGVG